MKKLLHKLVFSFCLLAAVGTANAQSQTYFREGFNEGAGQITGTTANSIPAKYVLQDSSGTWYAYGIIRTSSATGACATQTGNTSHIRFVNQNTAFGTTGDSSYIVTPVVNFGINTISYYNGRASRRINIFKTTDTAATTNAWTLVEHIPATNTACQFYTITVNDAAAKRLKIVARADTDSDMDSITMTSVNPILPVTFAGISAAEVGGKVTVNWKVASEYNTARYSVERSTNGISFAEVGSVTATNARSYNWLDATPAAGTAYYRIKSVDHDGAANYTSVVKINLSKRNFDFVIAPNPIKGSVVNLQVSALAKGNYGVSIFNSTGQQVFAKAVTHEGGSATYQLQLPGNVKSGVYNIQLKQGEIVLNKKLVVE